MTLEVSLTATIRLSVPLYSNGVSSVILTTWFSIVTVPLKTCVNSEISTQATPLLVPVLSSRCWSREVCPNQISQPSLFSKSVGSVAVYFRPVIVPDALISPAWYITWE